MRRALAGAACAALLALGGCSSGRTRGGAVAAPAPPPERFAPADGVPGCRLYAEPREAWKGPAELPELSGLAASRRHPGVLWAHNDSGQAPVLYALGEDGAVRARLTLTGVEARDLEDVAVGPCAPRAEETCVWLADTGDNLRRRERVQLLRVREPERLEPDARLAAEALPLRYPDGAHDAEALVVFPGTGELGLVTKTLDGLGEVFLLEGLGAGREGRARRLGALGAPAGLDRLTTAADVHPSGERMLLRTATRAWELRRPGARSLAALIQAEPVEVPRAPQPKPEAAAYLVDGRGYVLGSEFAGEPVFVARCR